MVWVGMVGSLFWQGSNQVDRSASYAARYIAKNVVAAGLADKCEIGLAYAIGVARPLSIFVDTFEQIRFQKQKSRP